MNTTEQNNFPKGKPGLADYFNSTARVKILIPEDQSGTYAAGNVVLESGHRNNWHTHATGQILLVTDGKEYYRQRGQPARFLSNSDVVVIPVNTGHRRGAEGDGSFTHIVINNNSPESAVKWLGRVTYEEYNSLQQNSVHTLSVIPSK